MKRWENRIQVVRLQWLWLFAAPAILGSIFVPWGDKHIDDHHCESTWDPNTLKSGQACSSDEWSVSYKPFSLQTTHTEHVQIDSDVSGVIWAYHYTDPKAPHAKGIGPLLDYGGVALLLGAASMVSTGIMYQIYRGPQALLAARIGFGLYAGSVLSFILGMAYHAGTWRAEEVDNLTPAFGLLLGAIPLLAGMPLLPVREADQGLPALPTR